MRTVFSLSLHEPRALRLQQYFSEFSKQIATMQGASIQLGLNVISDSEKSRMLNLSSDVVRLIKIQHTLHFQAGSEARALAVTPSLGADRSSVITAGVKYNIRQPE